METLSARGHTVVEAETAGAARHVLAAPRDRFDVVLLDYCLPDSRDLSLLADVRRVSPESAVVMMTAGGYATHALGARRALTKPIDMETIEQVLFCAWQAKGWKLPKTMSPTLASRSAM